MLSQDLQTAAEFKMRLIPTISIIDMRLYGSRARGDASPGSDMDIFIEVEKSSKEIRDVISDTAWEIGLQKLIHISPLVYSKDEIENSPQRSSPVLMNIMHEGIQV